MAVEDGRLTQAEADEKISIIENKKKWIYLELHLIDLLITWFLIKKAYPGRFASLFAVFTWNFFFQAYVYAAREVCMHCVSDSLQFDLLLSCYLG